MINENESKNEKLFTKPVRDGIVEYIEIDVDEYDFDGFQVVMREFFSKANCPAITIKYGSIVSNLCAIRKLDECSHINLLINMQKKLLVVKPCDEDAKDSFQWSRINNKDTLKAREITGWYFTYRLYDDMKWNKDGIMKMLGTLLKCRGEKIFVFNLIDAEAYHFPPETSADDTKRRKRVPYMPERWQTIYGQSYEESKKPIISTFGEIDGFVPITIPKAPSKKPIDTEKNKHNLFNSSENVNKEETEDGTT